MDEEDNQSDDCLERAEVEMNKTEHEILNDLEDEDHLNDERFRMVSETRMQPLLTCENFDNDNSMIINSITDFK